MISVCTVAGGRSLSGRDDKCRGVGRIEVAGACSVSSSMNRALTVPWRQRYVRIQR